MLCQDCKKREAQVHFTQIVNNEKATLSLCKECAAARGFHSPLDNVPFPLADILSGMAASIPAQLRTEQTETITCATCGLTFDDFTRLGRFGCGDCYRAFRNRLEPIMRKIHGASLHRGRGPILPNDGNETVETASVREEERLETELKRAIEAEDFERAVELRDKLKTLRESLQDTK